MQEMTAGPEIAQHYAKALTLLHRREGDPVDPAMIVGADLAALIRLDEARHGVSSPRVDVPLEHAVLCHMPPTLQPAPHTLHGV